MEARKVPLKLEQGPDVEGLDGLRTGGAAIDIDVLELKDHTSEYIVLAGGCRHDPVVYVVVHLVEVRLNPGVQRGLVDWKILQVYLPADLRET